MQESTDMGRKYLYMASTYGSSLFLLQPSMGIGLCKHLKNLETSLLWESG